jgi:sugar O-acyltransferase (sialic acid O-acetyltransferase NeuD family)
MSTNKVVIFGTNDFAELAHFYLTTDSIYEVVGFAVHESFMDKKEFCDLPVVSFEKVEEIFPPNDYKFFAPMSGSKMNILRENVFNQILEKKYELISYISSKATLFNNKIGKNCFILENNTIQPFVEIGDNVVMWSGNHIGHHSKIENHVFFTSHVVLSGHCHVKKRAWFGVNSTIRDGITIGENCLVSMGALVTKNTEENSFYLGVPAKKQEKTSLEIL